MKRAYFELQIQPVWEVIDPTREFLLSFFSAALDSHEIAHKVCVAVHELLENAVKYSREDWIAIRAIVDHDLKQLNIAVENPAMPEHIPVLQAEVRAAQQARDPMAFLMQKIAESCSRQDGKSCVGLARVRCEAEMWLDCVVKDGVVCLVAKRSTVAAGH
jgi:hypothetical protein